jgi:hypothetical protein
MPVANDKLAAAPNDVALADAPDGAESHDYEDVEQVEYVLAKQYKSLHTREKLGFPAYSIDKKLVGFFTANKAQPQGGGFLPIRRLAEDFGSAEIQEQATRILQEAMDRQSDMLHAKHDWSSLDKMLDHVIVYDYSKDTISETTGDLAELEGGM